MVVQSQMRSLPPLNFFVQACLLSCLKAGEHELNVALLLLNICLSWFVLDGVEKNLVPKQVYHSLAAVVAR